MSFNNWVLPPAHFKNGFATLFILLDLIVGVEWYLKATPKDISIAVSSVFNCF